MMRTSIMLSALLKTRAKREARRQGISLGELIRRSLAQSLPPALLRPKGTIFDLPTFDGPPPHDVSTRVDDSLYGGNRQ